MTYNEFKNKYNGKWVDYDGAYGCQCWDLGQKYFTECLRLPSSVLAGCGLVSNMLYPPKRAQLDKYFDEISVNNMVPGDVCIWEYGHIAIFDHYSGSNKYYFSQNPNPCQVIRITAGGVHAFRLKGSTTSTDFKVGDKVKVETPSPYKYYVADATKYLYGIYQVAEYWNAGGKDKFDWRDNGIPETCLDKVDANGNKTPDSDRVHLKAGDKFVFARTFTIKSTANVDGVKYVLLEFDNRSDLRFWVITKYLKKV